MSGTLVAMAEASLAVAVVGAASVVEDGSVTLESVSPNFDSSVRAVRFVKPGGVELFVSSLVEFLVTSCSEDVFTLALDDVSVASTSGRAVWLATCKEDDGFNAEDAVVEVVCFSFAVVRWSVRCEVRLAEVLEGSAGDDGGRSTDVLSVADRVDEDGEAALTGGSAVEDPSSEKI